jgi:HPt (histidine-containing phosphotransfer) domain-containing protein
MLPEQTFQPPEHLGADLNDTVLTLQSLEPADGFDDLRAAFRARVEIERLHFAKISAALAHAEDDPSAVFEDLYARAHRLHGGALIFALHEIAAAASALEQAALSASKSRADNTDVAVWNALVKLVCVFADMDAKESRPPGDLAPVARTQ